MWMILFSLMAQSADAGVCKQGKHPETGEKGAVAVVKPLLMAARPAGKAATVKFTVPAKGEIKEALPVGWKYTMMLENGETVVVETTKETMGKSGKTPMGMGTIFMPVVEVNAEKAKLLSANKLVKTKWMMAGEEVTKEVTTPKVQDSVKEAFLCMVDSPNKK